MWLDGLKILDLTRLLPGPYATMLLSDMGADVLKVEDPALGDYSRSMEPIGADGMNEVFHMINRGKRSLALNLQTEEGRDLFYRLVEDADVVFEQFRPGVAERLGIDYESLCEVNPELIYCSLSGYGQEGPYSGRVGHDLNYIGVGGLLGMNRSDVDERPTIPGTMFADLAGGIFAAFAILGAITSRSLGNSDGDYIDVSMTDTVLALAQIPKGLVRGAPRPGRTLNTGAFPWYDVYETADGEYVTLAAAEPKFWERFCKRIRKEHLTDEHTVDTEQLSEERRDEIRREVASYFRSKTQADVVDALADDETMVAEVNTLMEAFDDPQIRSRGIVEGGEAVPLRVRFPANVSSGLQSTYERPPELGEHTDKVMQSMGLDPADIEGLRERDVI